jgi:hypothetical protein
MMKKTVIRRHSKKADISSNVAHAIESDIRIEGGEPLGDFLEGAIIESAPLGPDKKEPDPEFNPQLFREAFEKAVKNAGVKYGKMSLVYEYVAKNAATYKMSAIDVMKNAMQDMGRFMKTYSDWSGAGKEAPPAKKEPPEQIDPIVDPMSGATSSGIMTDAHASHLIDLCSAYDMHMDTVISEMGLEGEVFMLPDRFYSDCVNKIHSLAETAGKEYRG